MKISICNQWSINNRLPREIAKRYLTGAGRPGLNRLYTKYYRLTTNWPSTLVESALQIRLFMQNKPNFLDAQMNLTSLITVEYENKSNWTLGENKPNSNPIKANTKPIKANKMPIQTQYKPKTNPIKPNSPSAIRNTQYEIRDTNPIKPN